MELPFLMEPIPSASASGAPPPAEPRNGARPRTSSSAMEPRSEEHTSELQSRRDLVCRLLLEKKKLNIETCRRMFSSFAKFEVRDYVTNNQLPAIRHII